MHINQQRTALRFSLTTAFVFILGMICAWESAYLAAVFTSILLERDIALPIKAGTILLLSASAIYVLVFVIFTLSLPYPILFFAGIVLALACVCALSVSGKSNLLVIMSLFAVLIIPYIAMSSVNVAWTQTVWIPLNLGIAMVATWCAFAIIPPANQQAGDKQDHYLREFDKQRRFLRMMLATVPFVIVFLLIDGEHLLTLLYFGLFSNQLATSNENASVTPVERLLANLAAIFIAVIAYEVMVIAPTIVNMMLVILLFCLCYGWWLSSHSDNRNLARSALTGTIILLGDAISPLADIVEVSAIERIIEVSAAVILVYVIFYIIDRQIPERALVDGSS